MTLTLNQTLETINNSVDINKTIESSGGWLNNIDWKNILGWFGNQANRISGLAIDKGSQIVGKDLGVISLKILTILILVGVFYLSLSISKKTVKYILIFLIVIFIVSVAVSIFI